MKILIAEDDLTSQTILKTTLIKAGYSPTITANGNTACEIMLKVDAPKLAILDWMMPGMDGLTICRKIREAKILNQPYLIIVTVRNKTEEIVKGLEAGANDYIIKPYNVSELQVRVGVGKRVVELQSTLAGRINELQEALAHIKTLQGILPICMYCKKIRNDKQYWQKLESYIAQHSNAEFSHGICPACYKKHVLPSL